VNTIVKGNENWLLVLKNSVRRFSWLLDRKKTVLGPREEKNFEYFGLHN
jgi:hypothetical protein